MAPLKAGMVVVSEGNKKKFLSRMVMWLTGSIYSHAFIMVDSRLAVEARFPGVLQFWKPAVREFYAYERLEEIEAQGRRYVVMDMPCLTEDDRENISEQARGYIGRRYDVLQALLYAVFKEFILDGPKRLECSRLITASYWEGATIPLFTPSSVPETYRRRENLFSGYATPGELVEYSRLTLAAFTPE